MEVMGNRSRTYKKPNKWHGLEAAGWEIHHIDGQKSNNHKQNLIALPVDVHVNVTKKMQSYRGGILSGGCIPRTRLEQDYKSWIQRKHWSGTDPNNGDQYERGRCIRKGPVQLDLFAPTV